MIETKDYWTYEDKFIFKPHFYQSIDIYKDIISNYSQLIFSNYYDVKKLIKLYDDYYDEYCDEYNHEYCNEYSNKYNIKSKSIFNEPINISTNLNLKFIIWILF